MTYCLAIAADSGIVFVSDSRTSAGVDQINTYSKMYGYGVPGERQFTIMTSGNLATSQGVMAQIRKDLRGEGTNLFNLGHMTDVAEYIGELSRIQQDKTRSSDINVESNFLIGGQIGDQRHCVFMIYPQGNYISTSNDTTYLQIGETKYGKPILDRILSPDVSLETAAMCALVSMDSTMRSNLTVGPPIELSIYEVDSLEPGRYYRFDDDSKYLRQLKRSWDIALKDAFKNLPPVAWSTTWDRPQKEENLQGSV